MNSYPVKHPGKLIIVEGTDGSGKGTQTALLADRIRADGQSVRVFDFPRYDTPSGREIKDYLKPENKEAMDKLPIEWAVLTYAKNRLEVRDELWSCLKSGETVVCNRYVMSNMAHQGARAADPKKRLSLISFIERLEYDLLKLPRPDLTIMLLLPAVIGQHLALDRARHDLSGQTSLDAHEQDLDHLQTASLVYQQLAQIMPKVKIIDCLDRAGVILEREAIAAKVWLAVAPLLKKTKI